MCMNTTSSECNRYTFQGLAYMFLFVPGILLHIVAFHAFISRLNSWTDTHIYMFNVALADFTFIVFLPFRIYDSFWCLPKTKLCTFLFNMHYLNMYASILTTAAVSVHRYLAVKFPMQIRSWRRKKETAGAVCLLIWVLLLTVCIVFREENNPDKLWTCYKRCKDNHIHLYFLLILLLLGFLFPLLIIVFCSSQIIYILRKHNGEAQKKNIIGIVTTNLVVFVVCYTPINVGYIVSNLNNAPVNWHNISIPAYDYLMVAEWIASTNCCFDSISYYFLLKHFYSQ